MRPYQEEYVENVKEYVSLTLRPGPQEKTTEEYARRVRDELERRRRLVRRNMDLLRGELLPALDRLSEADEEERRALQEFSTRLLASPKQVDVGLACQIQETLLALARQENDPDGTAEHLYWLGIARFNLANKLVNLEREAAPYYEKLRACFREVADRLEEFEQVQCGDTKSYIIRSLANKALGRFPTVGERTRLLKEALSVMEDPRYRAMAPNLPWDRFVTQVHQLMITSFTHSRGGAMTSHDVADIMRSVYIVYRGMEPTPRQEFQRIAIEYYCGVYSLDYLLKRLEYLMDTAGSRDFSPAGSYALISLPAFYCLYLSQYPERVRDRERFYLAGLYRRIQSYLNAYPEGTEDENLFFFLRQLLCTFIEVPTGIPYGQFLSWLLLRFSPEIRIHCRIVSEMSEALSGFALDQDGDFFDGIDLIRDIRDPVEKRRAALDYAAGCGLFHDAGEINCLELHIRTARRWSPMEDEMARLHTVAGYTLLSTRPSTSRYAAAALGHHAWYNGNTVMGYPAAYRRADCPERRMVDVVALCDWLAEEVDLWLYGAEAVRAFDRAAGRAVRLGGTQFSPRLTALLNDGAVLGGLRQAMEDGRQRAYGELVAAAAK